MNLQASNPYAPPASELASSDRERPTGIGWLVVGGILMCTCYLIVAYLMIKIVPEIRAYQEQRSISPQPSFRWMIQIADFLILRWWYMWPFVFAAAIAIVNLSPASRRAIWRRRIGITISTLAIVWAAFTILVTTSAMP